MITMSRLRNSRRVLRETNYEEVSDGVLNEDEQKQIIEDFEQLAVDQEELYKIAFTTLLIFPTPLYILLPYCRYNSLLSLLSLTSIFLSTYIVYYGSRFGSRWRQILWLNVGFGTIIIMTAYVKHWPWKRFDYIWILPLFSAVVSTILRRWFDQTLSEIARLRKAQYSTKRR